MLNILFIVVVLFVLEILLFFDNVIVNVNKLKDMMLIWQCWFLIWGIFIVVFGMWIVFLVVVVVVVVNVGLFEVVCLVVVELQEYVWIMIDVWVLISVFGGMFLLMVVLLFFFDFEKDVYWIVLLEKLMC